MALLSIVIPAYNEEAVLGNLLDALRPGLDDGTFEGVVVANGCTDGTAGVARRYPVHVVELEAGGKSQALNAGDAAASVYPRFYIDGDVVLTADAVRRMAGALEGDALAVAPGRVLETGHSTWPVRSYLRIWDELDSTRHSLAGRGCYGVSSEGRARWDAFPDLVADDGFVNSLFAPDERRNVPTVESRVLAPRDLGSLVARKRRGHRGNLELEAEGSEATSLTGWLQVIRRSPARIVDAPAYLAVTLVSRWLGRRDLARGSDAWGSDRSSRSSGTAAS